MGLVARKESLFCHFVLQLHWWAPDPQHLAASSRCHHWRVLRLWPVGMSLEPAGVCGLGQQQTLRQSGLMVRWGPSVALSTCLWTRSVGESLQHDRISERVLALWQDTGHHLQSSLQANSLVKKGGGLYFYTDFEESSLCSFQPVLPPPFLPVHLLSVASSLWPPANSHGLLQQNFQK